MGELVLFSMGLLSKAGFGDGDMPDELEDWLNGRCVDLTSSEWHSLLCVLVREHLLPALDQAVDVVEIETIHNPIRATSIDGVEIDEDVWYGRLPGPTLTPSQVSVPFEVVLERWRATRGAAT